MKTNDIYLNKLYPHAYRPILKYISIMHRSDRKYTFSGKAMKKPLNPKVTEVQCDKTSRFYSFMHVLLLIHLFTYSMSAYA